MEIESPPDSAGPPIVRYATFTRRARAVVVDSAIVSGAFIVILIVGDNTDAIPGSGRVLWFLFLALLLLYEPVFVWRLGATPGHRANHLSVVAERTGGRPTFGQAFARYLIKILLGLPSFITMVLTRRHQAVHDVLTHTTVRSVAPIADAEPGTFHLERDEDSGVLPTRLRRVLVMIGYLVLEFVVVVMLETSLVPTDCLQAGTCTIGARTISHALSIGWLVASLATIVAVWRGMFFGARRSPSPAAGVVIATGETGVSE